MLATTGLTVCGDDGSTSEAASMDHGVVLEAGEPAAVFEAPEHPRLRRFLSQVR